MNIHLILLNYYILCLANMEQLRFIPTCRSPLNKTEEVSSSILVKVIIRSMSVSNVRHVAVYAYHNFTIKSKPYIVYFIYVTTLISVFMLFLFSEKILYCSETFNTTFCCCKLFSRRIYYRKKALQGMSIFQIRSKTLVFP